MLRGKARDWRNVAQPTPHCDRSESSVNRTHVESALRRSGTGPIALSRPPKAAASVQKSLAAWDFYDTQECLPLLCRKPSAADMKGNLR